MTEGGLAGPRYAAFDEIGAGGMATVHLGRQIGAAGFSKTVAIKRLRPEHVRDAEFVAMFADEARLAARVRHPNVVQTLDVVGEGGELFLVLEYVHGESLEALVEGARALGERAPPDVASALVVGVLAGLQAAHVAKADGGAPLELVHRDVSPHNVLVGADGVARLIDFGIAKASVRLRSTRDGKLMGKLPYMAPEQLEGDGATPLSDLYSAGVVLWELLAGRRLFEASSEGALLAKILAGRVPPLASYAPTLPPALGELVARALSREPGARFASAHEMAVALELALPPASPRKVGEWVERVAQPQLARRAERVAAVERETAAAPSPFAGAARVTLSPEGRPGAVPELAFAPAPLPLAPARRTGPDGETMTMTAPRAPQRLPHAAPAAAPSPPSRRPRLAWALGGAALVLCIALPLAWRSASLASTQRPDALPASAASLSLPAASLSPSAGALSLPAASLSPSAGSLSPPAASLPQPSAPRTRRSAAPRRTLTREPALTPPSPASPPAAQAPCDPPYYIDASGIRRVKRACL